MPLPAVACERSLVRVRFWEDGLESAGMSSDRERRPAVILRATFYGDDATGRYREAARHVAELLESLGFECEVNISRAKKH